MEPEVTQVRLNLPAYTTLTTNAIYARYITEGWRPKGYQMVYNGISGVTSYLITFTRARKNEA